MRTSARLAIGCLGFMAGCSTTVEIGGQDRQTTPVVTQNVDQLPEAITTTSTIDLLSPYITIEVDEHDDRYIPPTSTTTSTTIAVPVQAPVAQGDICTITEADTFAHSILDPYGIPVPAVEFTQGRSYYPFGQHNIVLEEGCVSRSIVAHEIGHYVQALAFGMVPDAVIQNSLLFTSGTWIKGEERVPGIEYAAHCIGNVLYGNGPYTKCPSAELRQLAREVINRA